MKSLWGVLNNVINKDYKYAMFPDYMIKNDQKETNMDKLVNAFNDFFVNIGPELASKIATSDYNYAGCTNKIAHSMFLTATNENEMIKIVNDCKNKKSTDWNDLDMAIIKKVICNIETPLTYICNTSFLNGEVPQLMKIAKVIPIYKNGDSHQFTNY